MNIEQRYRLFVGNNPMKRKLVKKPKKKKIRTEKNDKHRQFVHRILEGDREWNLGPENLFLLPIPATPRHIESKRMNLLYKVERNE